MGLVRLGGMLDDGNGETIQGCHGDGSGQDMIQNFKDEGGG
jgi:hypothetical protein